MKQGEVWTYNTIPSVRLVSLLPKAARHRLGVEY
jgi:hypothetical protein